MRGSPLPNGCASGLEGTHQVTVLVRQGHSRYDGIYWGWQTCPGPTSGVHGEHANRGDSIDSASNVQSIEDNI